MELLLRNEFWIGTAVLSLILGGWIQRWDRRTSGKKDPIDPQRMTWVQVLYAALLAYPFCVFWLMAERWFGE